MADEKRLERLRKDAESALATCPGRAFGFEFNANSEYRNKLHSLDVYRTELELQNEELRQTQLELEAARDRYADLYDFAPTGYFSLSEAGRIIEVNLSGAALLSTSRSELIGRPLTTFAISQDIKSIRNHLAAVMDTGTRQVCEVGIARTDGTRIFVRLESILVRANAGTERHMRTAATDVTEKRLADEALRTLFLAVEQSPVAVVVTDTTGSIKYANSHFSKMTGYPLDELIGKNPRILKSGQTTDQEYQELWSTIRSGKEWSGALLDKKKDGTTFWIRAHITPVMDNAGVIAHYMAIEEDITLEKLRNNSLERHAAFDYLTGLPNRLLAFDRLENALSRMSREQTRIAVLILDLDHFKTVNDTLGHASGDQLLVQVGARLSALLRTEDTIARLGGDEFMVILPSIRCVQDVEAIAAKIVNAFTNPFVMLPQELYCTISVGIAVAPDDGLDPHVLIRNADTAMYAAKAAGRNTHRYFVERMNLRVKERMTLATHLRHAMERGELHLVYQPLVNVRDGAVIGAEALMRWTSPELGPVAPGVFIPLAEELGLIVSIGQWLLETVCRQILDWRSAGEAVPRISINISSRQFREDGFATRLLKLLSDRGLQSDRIELEITESLLMLECQQTTENIRALRHAGVLFSIDDFGTGYSSLSYLKRFRLHTLKIDRAFISDLPDNGDAAILTKAIISMAQQLKMMVVAEGVETSEQLQFLKVAGCDVAQGYLFSKGVPPDQFSETIKNIKQFCETNRHH